MRTSSTRLTRLGLFVLFGMILGAANCYDPDDHSPTSPATQEALLVSLSADSLPADGTSTLVVTAEIDPRAADANRTLVFETSAGRFLEATADPFRSVERGVDSEGRATATLRSSRDVGPVEITVRVKDQDAVLVRMAVEFVRAEPSGTISFVDLPESALADDTTLTPITVEIDPSLPFDPATRRQVTFTTTRGTFATTQNATVQVPAGADNRARVDLKSPQEPGTARLTATVDGVAIEAPLELVPAFPETIFVNPAKPVLQATNEAAGTTPVVIRLARATGKVSPATLERPILIEEDSGAEIPVLFRDLEPVGSDETVTITLTVGSVPYRGPALIEIRVVGASVVGRARIEIVDPPAS